MASQIVFLCMLTTFFPSAHFQLQRCHIDGLCKLPRISNLQGVCSLCHFLQISHHHNCGSHDKKFHLQTADRCDTTTAFSCNSF